jgi:hypothetical protein
VLFLPQCVYRSMDARMSLILRSHFLGGIAIGVRLSLLSLLGMTDFPFFLARISRISRIFAALRQAPALLLHSMEGLGTAPPLGLHWGVIFKFLKGWLFLAFSAYWTAVSGCRRLTNQCSHLFRLRLQFFWHGFHGLHGFFLERVLGVRGFW